VDTTIVGTSSATRALQHSVQGLVSKHHRGRGLLVVAVLVIEGSGARERLEPGGQDQQQPLAPGAQVVLDVAHQLAAGALATKHRCGSMPRIRAMNWACNSSLTNAITTPLHLSDVTDSASEEGRRRAGASAWRAPLPISSTAVRTRTPRWYQQRCRIVR